jgi:hypothetical protein
VRVTEKQFRVYLICLVVISVAFGFFVVIPQALSQDKDEAEFFDRYKAYISAAKESQAKKGEER